MTYESMATALNGFQSWVIRLFHFNHEYRFLPTVISMWTYHDNVISKLGIWDLTDWIWRKHKTSKLNVKVNKIFYCF